MGKASRQSFGEALVELGKEFPQIVVLDADLSKSTKSEGFAKAFPDRFFQMGIQEANMVGVASGLAASGKIPFLCSFACFLTGRFDVIRLSAGYSNANMRLVGTHSGIGIGEDGYSQMGLEDIACMRSIPGMAVLQPADDIETKSIMKYLVRHQGPVYLRLTRQNLDEVHKADFQFQLGKANQLKAGTQAVVFATGGLVGPVLKAAQEVEKDGLSVAVLNFSSLKPIDRESILSWGRKVKTVFTAEDHSTIGGLGSAVAETLSELSQHGRLVRIGVPDVFGESGTPEALYEKHGFHVAGIVRTLRQNLG